MVELITDNEEGEAVTHTLLSMRVGGTEQVREGRGVRQGGVVRRCCSWLASYISDCSRVSGILKLCLYHMHAGCLVLLTDISRCVVSRDFISQQQMYWPCCNVHSCSGHVVMPQL